MKTSMRNESDNEKRIRASPSRGADALFTDFEASQAVCALKTRAVFSR